MLSASQFDGAQWISYPKAFEPVPRMLAHWVFLRGGWSFLLPLKELEIEPVWDVWSWEELLVLEGFRTGWHQQFVLDAGPNVVSVAGCERSLNPFVLWLGNCFHTSDFTLIVADRQYRHKTQVGFWLPWVKIKEHKARRKPTCEVENIHHQDGRMIWEKLI